MQILGQMRGLLCGQRRIWRLRAERTENKSAYAPDARLWGGIPACLRQKSEKKKSGWISLQFLMNWLVSRSAEAGL
jgi:hypothetical protein